MADEYAHLLELYKEAVVAVEDKTVIWVNSAAKEMFPEIKAEMRADEIFPPIVLEYDARRFAVSAEIMGAITDIVVTTAAGGRIITLSRPRGRKEFFDELLISAGGELKSALSVLSMTAKKICERSDCDKEYDAMLMHSYYRIARIAEGLTELGSGTAGELPGGGTCFDLSRLIKDIADTVGALTKKMNISVEASSDKTVNFTGDEELIQRMILMMLSNSIKYTSDGGRIIISANASPDETVISVEDNGRGVMPKNMLEMLHKYSYPRDTSDSKSGIGLGMFGIRRIAMMHGGDIVVESRENGGTKISAIIPKKPTLVLKFDTIPQDRSITPILTELSDVLGYDCYSKEFND